MFGEVEWFVKWTGWFSFKTPLSYNLIVVDIVSLIMRVYCTVAVNCTLNAMKGPSLLLFKQFLPFDPLNGKSTCLQKDRMPFSSIFPGSQKAFFSFFFTCAGESSRSILESSSDELILLPVRPGTTNKRKFKSYQRQQALYKFSILIHIL